MGSAFASGASPNGWRDGHFARKELDCEWRKIFDTIAIVQN
jgi:hypothetical protein